MADQVMLFVKAGVAVAFLIASGFAWYFGRKFMDRVIKRWGGGKPLTAMTLRDGLIMIAALGFYVFFLLGFVRGTTWGVLFVTSQIDNPGSRGSIAIDIGGQALLVPRAALEIGERRLSGEVEELVFERLLPDFAPNVGPFGRPIEGYKGAQERIVEIFLRRYHYATDIALEIDQRRFAESRGAPKTYGLVQFLDERRRSRDGEAIYHYDFGKGRMLELRCGVTRFKAPSVCSASYTGYARFQLRYEFADKHLADWQRIHGSVIRLVDGFLPEADRSTRT